MIYTHLNMFFFGDELGYKYVNKHNIINLKTNALC